MQRSSRERGANLHIAVVVIIRLPGRQKAPALIRQQDVSDTGRIVIRTMQVCTNAQSMSSD
jgi:hypothetical protein